MATKSKKNPYKWADGSYHSIPASTHRQNVQAKKYGIDLNAPVSAPISTRTAYGQAEAAADRAYGPQISAAQGIQTALPTWFGNYVQGAQRTQAQQQALAKPVLDTAQQSVVNAAQTAPGLDASSPQYAKEQQAAQGRQAIAGLGASTLGAVNLANDAYIGGAITSAQRELPQAQAYYGTEVGRLKGLRGQGVVDEYGRIRSGEQNADIARSTLNLNTAKAADINPLTGKPNPKPPEDRITSGAFAGETDSSIAKMTPAERQAKIDAYAKKKGTSKDKVNAYGIKESQWATWSAAHRQRVIRDFKGSKTQGDKDAYGNTPKQVLANEGKWSKARNAAKTYFKEGDSWQSLYEFMLAGNPTLDPNLARAAAQWKVLKRVGSKSRSVLTQMSLTPPGGAKRKGSGVSNEKSTGGTSQDSYGSGPGHH